jgi:GDPmannose 4,6-dehydratase
MFGNNIDSDNYQRITTKMEPVSPYGISKLAAHNLAVNYRASYDMFIISGILFNHESPRRGANFVTAKVIDGAVKIFKNKSDKLVMGNLNAIRDWGHSKDYVRAIYLMMQNDTAKDYVVSSGDARSIQNLIEYAFNKLNLDHKKFVVTDEKYLRPEELNILRGDCTPIKQDLGWQPEYNFESLIDEMIEYYMHKE